MKGLACVDMLESGLICLPEIPPDLRTSQVFIFCGWTGQAEGAAIKAHMIIFIDIFAQDDHADKTLYVFC